MIKSTIRVSARPGQPTRLLSTQITFPASPQPERGASPPALRSGHEAEDAALLRKAGGLREKVQAFDEEAEEWFDKYMSCRMAYET